jgi:transposase
MLHLSASCAFYLYSGFADMRSGFDSLSGLIRDKMDMNALSGSVLIKPMHSAMKKRNWKVK